MAQLNFTLDTEIIKGLCTLDGRDNSMAKLIESIINQVFDAQATEIITHFSRNILDNCPKKLQPESKEEKSSKLIA
ncbi:MAG: hypothetical protein PHV56_04625 [Clostridia bacterium]|nr:hypothetical protein [Clostridia bacterium]